MSNSKSISNTTSSATPAADHPFIQLPRTPLVPERILRRYGAFCSFDNRFRAAARLLQCLWLRDRDIPTAFSQAKDGKSDESATHAGYGSILSAEAANAGHNFLSPAIHRHALQSWLLCEEDACIDEERLFGNALSSAGTTGNVMSPFALSLDLASTVFRRLLPGFVQTVERIELETSPGRRDPRYLDDRTAFDAAIHVITPEGEPCIIYTEMKYSETLDGPVARWRPRYDEALKEARLHQDPESLLLRSAPLEQLTREHLLTALAVNHGVTPKAVFLAIGPALNRRVQGAFQVYLGELIDADRQEPGRVPFIPMTLETVIRAIADAGAIDHARALWDRYCDFERIYRLSMQEFAGDASPAPTNKPEQQPHVPPLPPTRRTSASTNARRTRAASSRPRGNTSITKQEAV